MTTYTLNVVIDNKQLLLLKENCYTLCIAKKVRDQLGDKYNVVWKGTADFTQNNQFKWAEQYEVFALKSFKIGALVEAASKKEPIGHKQECIFNDSGVMEHAKADPNLGDDTFKVTNQYGATSFGISTILNGEHNTSYISPVIIKGHVVFAPVNDIRVWFALKLPTGTMFSDFTGEYVELQFGGDKTTVTVCYDDLGSWKLKDSNPGVVG
ncbi:hypothetical protein GYMLUDRAFT_250864 [Collybiopsis luxurians FD-317 M1]|uniref:Uncharacterized protein n=1 Tax=Collybiopsis luxurians FD-317 M1 TaxID=944289 RepID=A0A0D0AR85_9AGAR|nr:hypothetical protein GYMLUDRAFT_250864 [Collybiopsis luxurians FD-317 M1]